MDAGEKSCPQQLHYIWDREPCELQMLAKTSYGCHLRQSASSIQMNLSDLHRLQCMSAHAGNPLGFKRVKPGRKEAPQQGPVDHTCALFPYSSIMWGKGNDVPSSNTFKQHQENGRHMQCLHVNIFLHCLSQCYLKCWRGKTRYAGLVLRLPFSCPELSVGALSTTQDDRVAILTASRIAPGWPRNTKPDTTASMMMVVGGCDSVCSQFTTECFRS